MGFQIKLNQNCSLLTFFYKLSVVIILFWVGTFSTVLGQVTMDSVGVGTAFTNHYSSYHVEFTISQGNNGQLSAGTDTIFVTFNNSTALPSSFSASEITINGVNPTSDSDINITGQQVSIITPNSYKNTGNTQGTVTVKFAESGKIRNPGNPGTYSISAHTSQDGSDTGTYSITTTTTTVSKAAVTPDPSVEKRSAKYTIGFSVGAGGFLRSNESTIHIDFPSGTFVPDGSIAGVEINGTAASANGDSSAKEVTIETPVNIDNNGGVNIVFGPASGLKNPSANGNNEVSKTLSIYTSSETTPVTSDSYKITSAQKLSSSSVSVRNDTANAYSKYSIKFFVSADDPNTDPVEGGPLSASNGDLIYITFRGSTNLASSISTSDISVTNINTGFSGNAVSSSIVGDTTVIIGTPVDIDEGEEVSITFTKGAGIQNPAISGNYKLKAETRESDKTTVIDSSNTSNPYSIRKPTTGVSQASVSITDKSEFASTDYTLNFSTGEYGRLLAGTSSISVIFPEGTDLNSGSADVNGNASNNLTVYDSNTNDKDTLEVEVPSGLTIQNSGPVTLDIYNSIVNPSKGSYNLGVYTSVEPSVVGSQIINIGGTSVTPSNPILGTSTANSASSYEFPFSDATSFSRNDGNDHVKVTFPEGTRVPSDISVGDISISGIDIKNLVSVSVDSSVRRVTVFVDATQAPLGITFKSSAGIINPSVPDANYYQASISTSKNTQPASTPVYEIKSHSTSPIVNNISANPNQKDSTDVNYDIQFTTGSSGRLDGNLGAGSDTIRVVFDRNGTLLPGNISANEITINGSTASWAETQTNETGNSDTLLIEMPDGLTINNNSKATISINRAAGLDNAGTAGTFSVKLSTTTETGFGSADYDLLASVEFTFGTLSKSNSVTNATSSYSFSFTTSTGSGLTAGSDSILITFPENTHLPKPFSKEYVRIENTKPSENPKVNGQQLSIKTPVDINQASEASVLISSSAEVLNPSLVATDFSFELETTQESDTINSSQYSTTSTSSTISTPNTSINGNGVDDTTTYNLTFNTGLNGRLIESGGSLTPSSIIVKFPSSTDFGNLSATIKEKPVSNISNNGDRVNLKLPDLPSDSVWNEDDVTLSIDGIVNPSSFGVYQVDVKTSVEPTYISSSEYSVTDVPPIGIGNINLNGKDTVNQYIDYSFDFTTDSSLAAGDGTVTISFPQSSEVPPSISNSAITIDNNVVDNVETTPLYSEVTITVPSTINSGDTKTIAIGTAAEITNPKEPATNQYQLKLHTNKQPADTVSDAFTIVYSKNTYIQNLGVEVDPEVNDEPTNWTVGFRTGAYGALKPGNSTIYIDFDQSIFNEDPVPSSAIKVNSERVSGVNRSGSILEIEVPLGATIKKNDTVTVAVDKAAGIQVDTALTFSKIQRKAKRNGGMPSTQATNNYTASSSAEPINATTSSNPLPIELAEVSINKGSENGAARVTWKTETEHNNYRFYIDRRYMDKTESKDSSGTKWKELDYVKGSGTTSSSQTYSYTDNTLEKAGHYQYRIRQVDYDNSSTIYGPFDYNKVAPESFNLKANYPNPFNPTTTIPYTIPEEVSVKIEVYNVLGKRVQTLVNSRQKAGTYRVNFDGGSLASGTYFIRFEAAGRNFIRKMLLLK